MNPDYYSILGIAPTATPDEIKRAYRQKAMQCHPDRGGSHARMLDINEAFRILSDPVLRKEYDNARAHPNDRAIQVSVATHSRQAREQAQSYPRQWSAFENWMDGFTRDVHAARYGEKVIPGFAAIPTAGTSVTGWLMIVAGGVIGLAFWFTFIRQPDPPRNSNDFFEKIDHPYSVNILGGGFSNNIKIKLMVLGICVSCGAGLGVWSHKRLARFLSQSPPPLPSVRIIQCPRCQQMLRLPLLANRLNVTCNSCKHAFIYDPSGR